MTIIFNLYCKFVLDILSSEHLTTKRQIESVREMFGEDNWLHSHAGNYVQDILGIKQQPEHKSFSEENTVKFLFSNIFKHTSSYIY